jgi:hypothetical protein
MRRQLFTAGLLAMALAAVAVWAQEANDGDQPEPLTDFRTWTSSGGSYTLEAAMLKFEKGKVHLLRRDGTTTAVPIEKLSQDDQKFVRSELARLKKSGRSGTGRASGTDTNTGRASGTDTGRASGTDTGRASGTEHWQSQ